MLRLNLVCADDEAELSRCYSVMRLKYGRLDE